MKLFASPIFDISSRINGYEESLRYLYTVLIAVAHIWYLFFDGTYFLEGAYLGVDFFFILSGYHLINTYNKNKLDTFSLIVKRYKNMMLIYVTSILCSVVSTNFVEMLKVFYMVIPDLLCIQSSGFFYPSVNVILWFISAMQIASFIILSIIQYNKELFFKVLAPLFVLTGYSVLFFYLNNLDGTSNIRDYIIPLGLIRAISGISLGIVINNLYECYINKLKDNYRGRDILIFYSIFFASLIVTGYCIVFTPHSSGDFMCLLAFPAMIVSTQVLGVIYKKGLLNRLGKLLCAVFGKQMTLAMYCFSIIIYRLLERVIPLSQNDILNNTLIYLLFLFLISGIISRMSDIIKKRVLLSI